MKYLITKDKKGKESLSKAIIKKFTSREFDDPVLQDLANVLNRKFSVMAKEMISEIKQVMKLSDREFFVKGGAGLGSMRANHKYIKRTGGPGNYRYWYKDEQGNWTVKDKEGHVLSGEDPNRQTGSTYNGDEHDKEVSDHPQYDHTITVDLPEDFEPTPKSKSNHLGKVHFTEDQAEVLTSHVTDAGSILDAMKVKFNTPINFSNSPHRRGEKINAHYIPKIKDGKFMHNIFLYNENKLSKSLMHEIGHAIDFSMSSNEGLISRTKDRLNISNDKLRTAYDDLINVMNNTPFFKNNVGLKNIDNDQEKFARAFEVYSYSKAKDLVVKGKIDPGFMKTFSPDVFLKISLTEQAKIEKKVNDHMDIILSKDKIKKSGK